MGTFAQIFRPFRKPAPAPVLAHEPPSSLKCPGYDPKMVQIINLCKARLNRQHFSPGMCAGLADPTIEWICTLSIEMLLIVSHSTQMKLREHINGRKSIRGVLYFDPISVAEYREAMRPKIPLIDHGSQRGGGRGPREFGGR